MSVLKRNLDFEDLNQVNGQESRSWVLVVRGFGPIVVDRGKTEGKISTVAGTMFIGLSRE